MSQFNSLLWDYLQDQTAGFCNNQMCPGRTKYVKTHKTQFGENSNISDLKKLYSALPILSKIGDIQTVWIGFEVFITNRYFLTTNEILPQCVQQEKSVRILTENFCCN